MNDMRDPARSSGAGPSCPFCGSADVELLSLFGSQLLTEQWYCRACGTPFEHIKDAVAEGDVAAWPHGGRTVERDVERGLRLPLPAQGQEAEPSGPASGEARDG
jgi:hypothetical protein